MQKKILVIGGTYFLGKAFIKMALDEGYDITIIHRGSNKLEISGVKEIFADRHDINNISNCFSKSDKFDAVIDFCGYTKGDAEGLLNSIQAEVGQYIFISTVDVYRRGLHKWLDENSPLEDRAFGGNAGEYIAGKVAIEKEIPGASKEKGCTYTIIRPAFIFGEENYAPREGIYFNWIVNAGQIIHPENATGEFQLVYVKDVAKAILLVIGNKDAMDRAFNVCENNLYTYDSFVTLLSKAIDKPFEKVELSVEEINEKGIPLPFPLTKEESNYYDGEDLKNLGIVFTDNVKAMTDTYNSVIE